jgi:hypothetical protein
MKGSQEPQNESRMKHGGDRIRDNDQDINKWSEERILISEESANLVIVEKNHIKRSFRGLGKPKTMKRVKDRK